MAYVYVIFEHPSYQLGYYFDHKVSKGPNSPNSVASRVSHSENRTFLKRIPWDSDFSYMRILNVKCPWHTFVFNQNAVVLHYIIRCAFQR